MSALFDQMKAALASRTRRQTILALPNPAELQLIDFTSNDYLSLSQYQPLRAQFLSRLQSTPDILGSCGSRLLVNERAHSNLEARLAQFFNAPAALLFNSGQDANIGFFLCVPQPEDVVVLDEYIHASVHDGVRASRVHGSHRVFSHNSVAALRKVLRKIILERHGVEAGRNSVFVAVESVYSMEGMLSPLTEIVELVEELFPKGNGYVVVDEAHATGIYSPQGRGIVALLGLEHRVLARLHTFGKALASNGAVIVTDNLLRDYMINYARSLIYSTTLSYASVISIDCSFDMLENGVAQKRATNVLELSSYLVETLRPRLTSIPSSILSLLPHLREPHPQSSTSTSHPTGLFSPMIAILTAHPKSLSAYLYAHGIKALAITPPTVPKNKARVRVCLHADNTRADIDRLVEAIMDWAEKMLAHGRGRMGQRKRGAESAVMVPLESKL